MTTTLRNDSFGVVVKALLQDCMFKQFFIIDQCQPRVTQHSTGEGGWGLFPFYHKRPLKPTKTICFCKKSLGKANVATGML